MSTRFGTVSNQAGVALGPLSFRQAMKPRHLRGPRTGGREGLAAGHLRACLSTQQEREETMTDKYVLKDGKPVPEPDLMKWARWLETSDKERLVKRTRWWDNQEVVVATFFLALDYNFSTEGPLLLYRTVVCGGELHDSQEDYATREQASEGHERWCRKVKVLGRKRNGNSEIFHSMTSR